MHYLFLIFAPVCAMIKAVVQGRYTKKRVNTFSDVLLYNCAVFFATAGVFAIVFLRAFPPIEVILYSLLGSVFIIGFQISYTMAFKSGPITASVIINSFCIVMGMVAGLIFFNEQWSILAIIGLVFMALCFYLVPARGENKKINIKWIIAISLSFLFSGANSTIALFFAKSEFAEWNSTYMVFSFAMACVWALIILLFNVKAKKEPITINKGWGLPCVALVIGGALGGYNLLNVYSLQYFESYIAMPVVNGAIIVLVMIVNSIIDREKPTLKTLFGVISAVIAIVLLNL